MDVPDRLEPPEPGRAPDLGARYRSLFEIGRGGMGTIEVALERAAGGFERIVALKRMHPVSVRDRRLSEMFLREARLAVWLTHANVVHAFDFGELHGELFLAMEYVEGETLSAIVRAARERTPPGLAPALAAAILAEACEGLHAAHELTDPQTGSPLNLIHRDVSPHNVMVSYEGHTKLLDFGVAKMDSVDPLTRTGEVKGKTSYMSPEQAMGEVLDRRSDLFSLGAVLFECVAGRKMWGSGTDMEVIRRLALENPPSLSEAAPSAPRELVELHARLVSRKAEGRPPSARAVADQLRDFAWRSGVPAGPQAVAQTMNALFAHEAADRKRRLNEAIAREAPAARVEVLRRSLAGPTALLVVPPAPAVPIASVPGGRETARAPLLLARELPATVETTSLAPRATRRGVVLSAAFGLCVAGVIVAVSSQHAPPSPLPEPTSATPAAPPPPPPSTEPTAASAAGPSASPPPSASVAPATPPSGRHRRAKPPAHPPSSEVDMHPF